MNKKTIFCIVLVGFLFFGFNIINIFAESVEFELILSDVGTDADSSPNGIKMSFRSSGLEFWASNGNYDILTSSKYITGGNTSTELTLSNTENNMVFISNNVKMEKVDMLNFDTTAIYDVVRMDIGAGNMSFSNGASDISIANGDVANLDANSIIFIDETKISKIYYIESGVMNQICANSPRIDVNEIFAPEDVDFMVAYIKANHNSDFITSEYPMDVDGALLIPFETIDFTKHANVKNVKLKVIWDMNDIFSAIEGDVYTLNENADGTPYDFYIQVEIY